jgi:hypothetical protein
MRIAISAYVILAALGAPCRAQERDGGDAASEGPAPRLKPAEIAFKHESFTFVRIMHFPKGRGRSYGRWATDYPDSDQNFSARFEKVTGLKTDPKGKVLALTDPALRKYSFAYLVEPGRLQLTPAEGQGLREYLLAGGFLMVDDFWGEAEWQHFAEQMRHVFPDREFKELDIEHPVFHCFYDIREKPQVPSIAVALSGGTTERLDAQEPHFRGLTDDRGRLMVLACHNTDLGDGWERAGDNPEYHREFSLKKAYPMGINIVVYALTR